MQTKNNKTKEFHSPWEKTFGRIMTPFEAFIHNEASGGILLMICAAVAMVIANGPFAEDYFRILTTKTGFSFGSFELKKTLHHWINDGLMALFFLLVGLEIKREVLAGELARPKQAALPIMAALGGMVMPALIYTGLNHGTKGISGWGIPMATDIAFAVGVLILLGKRAPKALLTFLVALAIVDDLGAVLVIAIFYTETIVLKALGFSALFLFILIAMNLAGIRKPLPYYLVGALLWFAMLKSGVHATLAGVLTAFTIPARPKFEAGIFSKHARALLNEFDASQKAELHIMQNETQKSILLNLEESLRKVETPLQHLEHRLHVPVAFFVIPVFALANAGVPVELGSLGNALTHPVTLGVIFGLLVGKLLGVFGFSYLAIKLGLCKLPGQVSLAQLMAVSLLAGIGFTMSIFIAELAFANEASLLLMAKTGILFASLVAGALGYGVLFVLGSGKARE